MRLSRLLFVACFLAITVCGSFRAFAQADPLPSWNESRPKTSIIEFVQRTTARDSPDFVEPELRIAVFDNDGTLWTGQPYYSQIAFVFDQIKAMAQQHPKWKGKQPFKDIIEGNIKSALATGRKGLEQILAATHAGMTTEEFAKSMLAWSQAAKHLHDHAAMVAHPTYILFGM